MSKERTCFVHIGTHKTGTTSIQAFLAANRARFAANGVVWPHAGTESDLGIVSHHQLAKELLRDPAFDAARGGVDDIVDELRGTKANVACITSEDLSFLYDRPQELIRLRDAILKGGFAPRIVVFLRPQASYCAAVYAENVRHGYRVSFDDYWSDVVERGRYTWDGGLGPPFDYNWLLDGFAQVFGADAIIARAYRARAPDTALLFSFANLLLASGTDLRGFEVPNVRHNGSLHFGEVLRLLGIEHNITEALRFTPLDIGKCLRLGRRFAGSNIRLAQRYGVVVPVFEPIDIALASPLRRTRSKMAALRLARTATLSMKSSRPIASRAKRRRSAEGA